MDPRLIITDVGYGLSAVFSICIGLFVYLKGPRKAENIIFALLNCAVAAFEISHAWGISVLDPMFSRQILLWNLANIFIVLLNLQWVLIIIGKARKRLAVLVLAYAASFILFFFLVLHPSSFLLPSVPKLYLPNYYNPGPFDLLMRVYAIALSVYLMIELLVAYMRTRDSVIRNRYKYVLVGLVYGYSVGWTAIPLVYNIPVDPIWSMFFGLYSLPFAYAIVQYELMDIRIVAKRALYYALFVGVVGVILGLINFSDRLILSRVPNFPVWILPLTSSAIAVGIGFFVWRKVRETDFLKYEFITVVTHKFRTPLTYIKWSADSLLQSDLSPEKKKEITIIQNADFRLVELTNLLIGLTGSEVGSYEYRLKPASLADFVLKIIAEYQERVASRGLRLAVSIEPNLPHAAFDEKRLAFVIQIMLDNALMYTPRGGAISTTLRSDHDSLVFSIADSGIGIPKNELPYVFTKFFRGKKAKTSDTEGMGIGLFMAKSIIERHNGKLSVASDGDGKGSVFSFTLPIFK